LTFTATNYKLNNEPSPVIKNTLPQFQDVNTIFKDTSIVNRSFPSVSGVSTPLNGRLGSPKSHRDKNNSLENLEMCLIENYASA